MSIFYQDLDRLADCFSCADLGKCMDSTPLPLSSDYDDCLPVLGCSSDVYRIIFRITYLSRCVPLLEGDLAEARAIENELTSLEKRLTCYVEEDVITGYKLHCLKATILYCLASQILLRRIIYQTVSTTEPYQQNRVKRSLLVIRELPMDVPMSVYLTWPMMIISGAARTRQDIKLLKRKLMEVWRSSGCGHVRWTAQIVDFMWKRLVASQAGEADGLDHLPKDRLCRLDMPGAVRRTAEAQLSTSRANETSYISQRWPTPTLRLWAKRGTMTRSDGNQSARERRSLGEAER